MDDQVTLSSSSADSTNDASVPVDKEGARPIPEPWPEVASDPARIETSSKENFLKQSSEILSYRFPKVAEFLKERFTNSVERRGERFLCWRQEEDNGRAQARKMWDLAEFEPVCQMCVLSSTLQSATEDSWCEHTIRELQPYICLMENCRDEQATFHTFEAWIEHTREDQRDFASEMPAFCPLCSYKPTTSDQASILQHVASHLRILALISLSEIKSHFEADFDKGKPATKIAPNPHYSIPSRQMVTVHSQVCPSRMLHERDSLRHLPQTIVPLPTRYEHPSLPQTFTERTNRSANSNGMPLPGYSWRPGDEVPNPETFDVLVAEDNLVNQRIMWKILGKYQHRVVLANNGQEAVAAIRKRRYDIILMDTEMPILDGYQAAKQIREYERSLGIRLTPIVALSPYGMIPSVRTRERMDQTQMDDYVHKPVRFHSLADIVLRYGRLGRSAAAEDRCDYLASISGNPERRTSAIPSIKSRL